MNTPTAHGTERPPRQLDPLMRIVGTELPGERWTGTAKEMHRRAAEQFKKFRGSKISNEHTGWLIGFNRTGMDKALATARKPDEFQSATALPELVRRAALVETHPHRERIAGIYFHRFYTPIRIRSEIYAVQLTVKEVEEVQTHRRTFYLHRLMEMKSPVVLTVSITAAMDGPTGWGLSLCDLLADVKLEGGAPATSLFGAPR